MSNAFLVAAVIAAATLTSPLAPALADELQTTPATSTACAQSDTPASTVYAAPPELPQIVQNMGLTGTAYVQVDTDDTGVLLNASIIKSSGAYPLDRAALQAAKASTFRPQMRNCVAIGGSYIFIVDFPAE
jgi:protein TonB